ncbi:MAG: hypothetical protein CMM52_06385 [Rhodospirillaceae bacterium]|nr:hypothetical protein [Rhodospirillaceae bacterium]|tara:strand:- start:470 stop:1498 length:1029 start_codon:yes stop_codon:yes gene_type:complete
MTDYVQLTKEQVRNHPLYGFGGWMIPAIIWFGIGCLLTLGTFFDAPSEPIKLPSRQVIGFSIGTLLPSVIFLVPPVLYLFFSYRVKVTFRYQIKNNDPFLAEIREKDQKTTDAGTQQPQPRVTASASVTPSPPETSSSSGEVFTSPEAPAPTGKTEQDSSSEQAARQEFYEAAYLELENDKKVIGVWARALAESDGEDTKAKARYIALRVEEMEAQSREKERSEQEARQREAEAIERYNSVEGVCERLAEKVWVEDIDPSEYGENFERAFIEFEETFRVKAGFAFTVKIPQKLLMVAFVDEMNGTNRINYEEFVYSPHRRSRLLMAFFEGGRLAQERLLYDE